MIYKIFPALFTITWITLAAFLMVIALNIIMIDTKISITTIITRAKKMVDAVILLIAVAVFILFFL